MILRILWFEQHLTKHNSKLNKQIFNKCPGIFIDSGVILKGSKNEIIEYAKNMAKTINIQSDFICADALNMPFKCEEFDIVFLVENNIVEFSFNDFKTMSESIYRILRIDGKFCISMNDCHLHNNGKTIDCSTLDCISGEKNSKYEIPGKGSF